MADDRDELIRSRAYEIWETEGSPHGRHDEHWSQAERELGEAGGEASAPAAEETTPAPDQAAAPSIAPSQAEPTPASDAAPVDAAASKRGRKPAAASAAAPAKGRRKKEG